MSEKKLSLAELIEERDRISLDLMKVYWDMQIPAGCVGDELATRASMARIAGERGKIGMKAIEKLEVLIAQAKEQKPENTMGGLSDDEIRMLMEYRANGKSKRPVDEGGQA